MAASYDNDFNAELIELLIKAGADPAYCSNGNILLYSYYLEFETEENLLLDEEKSRFNRIKELLKPAMINTSIRLLDRIFDDKLQQFYSNEL